MEWALFRSQHASDTKRRESKSNEEKEKKVKRTIDAVDGFWPHRTAAAADAEANVCVHLCWGSRANALEL